MFDPILKILADNPGLLEATKQALLDEFKVSETTLDSNYDDVRLGQIFRARLIAIRAIEEAFRKIAKEKSRDPVQPKFNEAR